MLGIRGTPRLQGSLAPCASLSRLYSPPNQGQGENGDRSLAYIVTLVQPLVMSRAVALRPVVVVLAIVVMGTLFGLIGLLLAVPVVAALSVLVHELWISRMEQIGVDPNPPTLELDEGEALRKTGLLQRVFKALRRSR
jgi:hypothetical protein